VKVLNIESLSGFTATEDVTGGGGVMPHSTGFIAYTFSQNGHKVKARLIITRAGKKGKSRLDHIDVNIPIIIDDKLDENDFKKIYSSCTIIKIEDPKDNVMNLSDIDFLGWAAAYRAYIDHITSCVGNGNSFWPKRKNHPVNIISKNLNDDIEYNIERASDPNFRSQCLLELMRVRSIVSGSITNLRKNKNDLYLKKAVDYLSTTYKSKFGSESDQVIRIEALKKKLFKAPAKKSASKKK
jgi:hypothetical protein